MSPGRAIVFDFDLTLADSSPGFIACHRFAAEKMLLPLPEDEVVLRSIGTPLHIVVPAMYGIDNDMAAEYVRLYQEHADEVMTGLTVMLDGASDAIRELDAAGYPLAIVSQKLRYRVEDVLRREELISCFNTILGGDDVPEFKPDPRGLLLACQRLDSTPDYSLYVGDTTIDAETARRAEVPFVGVLSGPAVAADFADYAPVALLPDVTHLAGFLKQYN